MGRKGREGSPAFAIAGWLSFFGKPAGENRCNNLNAASCLPACCVCMPYPSWAIYPSHGTPCSLDPPLQQVSQDDFCAERSDVAQSCGSSGLAHIPLLWHACQALQAFSVLLTLNCRPGRTRLPKMKRRPASPPPSCCVRLGGSRVLL